MFYERVAGLKLELAGDFANAYDDISAKSSARPEDRIHYRWYLQPRFDRAFRQHKIRFQRVGNIILHDFECAFSLDIGEGHAKLIEAPFRKTFPGNFPFRVPEKGRLLLLVQVCAAYLSMALAAKPFTLDREDFAVMLFFETLEHRSPDPATAVIGSQLPIGNDEHMCLGFLHHHLAGRDKDPEIDNRRLRPMLKPLGDGPAVLLVDKVELALLCRPAGAH